jgi:Tol biopolymer transport system component
MCSIKVNNSQAAVLPAEYLEYEKGAALEMVVQNRLPKFHIVALSPDRQFLLTGNNNLVKIWNINGDFLKGIYVDMPVNALAFSPDGMSFIIASGGHKMALASSLEQWSIDGKLIKSFKSNDYRREFYKIEFSKDGKMIAASNYKSIFIWDIKGELINKIKYDSYAEVFCFSPDGNYLLVGNQTSGKYRDKIKIYSTDGQVVKEGIESIPLNSIKSASFSPDGKVIAVYTNHSTKGMMYSVPVIKLLNKKGKLRKIFINQKVINNRAKGIEFGNITFSPDSKFIAMHFTYKSGTLKRGLKIWDLNGNLVFHDMKVKLPSKLAFVHGTKVISNAKKYKELINNLEHRFLQKGNLFVSGGSFIESGKQFISASDRIIVWNRDGSLKQMMPKKYFSFLSKMKMSSDGKTIIAIDKDLTSRNANKFIIHDLSSQVMIKVDGYNIDKSSKYCKFLKLDFFSKNKIHAVAKCSGYFETIYNINGELLESNKIEKERLFNFGSYFDMQSNDKQKNMLNKGDYYSFVNPSGEELLKLTKKIEVDSSEQRKGWIQKASRNEEIKGVMFSPDSQKLLILKTIYEYRYHPNGWQTASKDSFYSLSLWNFKERKISIQFKLNNIFAGISSFSFSPDSKKIVFEEKRNLYQVLSLAGEGEFLGSISSEECIFTPSSKSLLAFNPLSQKNITLFNLHGVVINKLQSGYLHFFTSFSPDGKIVAFRWKDGVRFYNLLTGNLVTLLQKGNEWISFTPDGYFISSQNAGSLIKMVKGLTAFSIDQFATKYNRPDVIINRLGIDDDELINHYYSRYTIPSPKISPIKS